MEDYYFGAMVGAVLGISVTLLILFGNGTISFEEFIVPMLVMNSTIIGVLIILDAIRNEKPK
jgi:hypothetical protein